MKLLNIYRSAPNDDVKKLVEIVSRDLDVQSFDLNVDTPDYDKMLDMLFDADQTICWW